MYDFYNQNTHKCESSLNPITQESSGRCDVYLNMTRDELQTTWKYGILACETIHTESDANLQKLHH